jgi:glycosyltransferase involved in cell wall biosynthesis
LTFAAASIARVPKIVFCIRTFNPSFGWTAIGDLLEKAHRKMIPFLSGILVNSTPLQEDYAAWLNVSKEKIAVCPNGIDPYHITENEYMSYRMDIRKRYNIDNNAVVIINVGRFSKEKGQLLLAKAFKDVQLNYDNAVYCLMCGDGYTKEAVKEYAAVNGLKNIIFTGRIDNVQEFLCASDLFVMPSDFEGMPNAMLEAMGYGLPCISTRRSGAMDVARDNIEALYIDVGSVEQLADKLLYLINRPDERSRLGRNARERLQDFSIEKMSIKFGQHLSSF